MLARPRSAQLRDTQLRAQYARPRTTRPGVQALALIREASQKAVKGAARRVGGKALGQTLAAWLNFASGAIPHPASLRALGDSHLNYPCEAV